jgi:hypothetical protein
VDEIEETLGKVSVASKRSKKSDAPPLPPSKKSSIIGSNEVVQNPFSAGGVSSDRLVTKQNTMEFVTPQEDEF